MRDCTNVSRAVVGGTYRQTMHGSAICWTCSECGGGLACVPYFSMCRQTTQRKDWAKKRVRTVIQGGQGRAQGRCRLQGLGTGDWGREGGKGTRGPPGAGNWERRPAWAKTKDVDRQRVLLALRPSGPSGPSVLRAVRLSKALRPLPTPPGPV